jgi:hypothetical protein
MRNFRTSFLYSKILGFLAFTLDGVESITPLKKPHGGTLTDEQKVFNQLLTTNT